MLRRVDWQTANGRHGTTSLTTYRQEFMADLHHNKARNVRFIQTTAALNEQLYEMCLAMCKSLKVSL